MSHALAVNSDLSWSLTVNGHQVQCLPLFSGYKRLTSSFLLITLLRKIDSMNVCPGHQDQHFIEMVKYRTSQSQSESISWILNKSGQIYSETVRSSKFHILS